MLSVIVTNVAQDVPSNGKSLMMYRKQDSALLVCWRRLWFSVSFSGRFLCRFMLFFSWRAIDVATEMI
jgi:hypothetical protein